LPGRPGGATITAALMRLTLRAGEYLPAFLVSPAP